MVSGDPSRQRTRDGGGPSGVLRNGASNTSVASVPTISSRWRSGAANPLSNCAMPAPENASCPAKVRSMPRSSYVAKPEAWTTSGPNSW